MRQSIKVLIKSLLKSFSDINYENSFNSPHIFSILKQIKLKFVIITKRDLLSVNAIFSAEISTGTKFRNRKIIVSSAVFRIKCYRKFVFSKV